MDTVGSSINVLFDQDTDRGGMSSESTDCSFILDDVSNLGSSPMCVWEAADSLNVFLGVGTHLAPHTSHDVMLAVAFLEPFFPPQYHESFTEIWRWLRGRDITKRLCAHQSEHTALKQPGLRL
jgi:hypothetical protein